jgi:NAD(P)H-dependent FMN reductase
VAILAISGSLNATSANTALLATVAAIGSEHDGVELFEPLDSIPFFRPDDAPAPAAVERLRAAARDADVVVIATPEYAGGMPGVLKNALDWLVGSGELYGKRVVIVSAAPSEERGHGARSWLEQTLRMQGARVVASFTVAVSRHQTREEQTAIARGLLERVRGALQLSA